MRLPASTTRSHRPPSVLTRGNFHPSKPSPLGSEKARKADGNLPKGLVRRHAQRYEQDGDDDGNHAVAESCETIFPHGCDLTSYQIVVVKAELCITAKLAADVRD